MLLIGRLWRGGAGGLGEIARLGATAAASATAAGLLLRALGRALSAPESGGGPTQAAVLRLVWCLPALIAVGWLCAVSGASVPRRRPRRVAGLAAVGVGPFGLRLLVAEETGLACAIGSASAGAVFLALRGCLLHGLPAERLAPALGLGGSLPAAGLATLLLVVPLVGAGAAALAISPGAAEAPRHGDGADEAAEAGTVVGRAVGPVLGPAGVRADALRSGRAVRRAVRRPVFPRVAHRAVAEAWAGGLVALGAVAEFGARGGWTVRLPVLGRVFLTGAFGWCLALAGLAAVTPLILRAIGGMLAIGPAGAVRLLAGRGLQALAPGLARPLAVAALGCGMAWGADSASGLGAAVSRGLAVGCALAALALRAAELRAARGAVSMTLSRLGASPGERAAAAALRATGAALAAALIAATSALLTHGL